MRHVQALTSAMAVCLSDTQFTPYHRWFEPTNVLIRLYTKFAIPASVNIPIGSCCNWTADTSVQVYVNPLLFDVLEGLRP